MRRETETDLGQARAALYIKANDLMLQDTVFIPVMHRLKVEAARQHTLRPVRQRLGQRNRQSVRLVPGGDGIIADGIFPS